MTASLNPATHAPHPSTGFEQEPTYQSVGTCNRDNGKARDVEGIALANYLSRTTPSRAVDIFPGWPDSDSNGNIMITLQYNLRDFHAFERATLAMFAVTPPLSRHVSIIRSGAESWPVP